MELMQTKSEIEESVQSKTPDNNQLLVAHKQAGKKTDKLQTICNALVSMTMEDDECFGKNFLNSLRGFSQEAAEEVNIVKNEMKTEHSNDVQEGKTEDSTHQNMNSINILMPYRKGNKGEVAKVERVMKIETINSKKSSQKCYA